MVAMLDRVARVPATRRFFLGLILTAFAAAGMPVYAKTITNEPLALTMARFRQIPCMDEQVFRFHRDTIRALDYTKMRAFRVFCTLPEVTPDEAVESLQRLVFSPLTFDQIPLLEHVAELPDVTVKDCWDVLAQTTGLDFTVMQAVKGLGSVTVSSPADILFLIDALKKLDESGCWAARELFSIRMIDGAQAQAGIAQLATMTARQSVAAERACRIGGISADQVLSLFASMALLSDTDAVNSAALMSDKSISYDRVRWWLDAYFLQSEADKPLWFSTFDTEQKTTLLKALSGGARYLIRAINDLHAVTDRFGGEIRTGNLVTADQGRLRELFARLHPNARVRFQASLYSALAERRKHDAVEALKQATAMSRNMIARDLTSANIYVLLAHGSELYDSSFRDILVPVLLERVGAAHEGNLLAFLYSTDPGGVFVSDFIVSCAQKGKLTDFLPVDLPGQQAVVDLMVASAMQHEQSLILFAATFETLLVKLQNAARSRLIDRIVAAIGEPDSLFALQLRVILQYYRDHHPDLLGKTDLTMIDGIISRYGRVDLTPFTRTDFKRWKRDGSLKSLSIFQNDDDGQISYLSYCRHLIASGYRPQFSETLQLLPATSQSRQRAEALLAQERRQPGSTLSSLYRLSVVTPVIIEWHRIVNGLHLSHAVAFYQDPVSQQRLLKMFMETGMELFAQRGHSYWREEQLLEPLQQLLDNNELSAETITAVNRFMSIGSCGGLRVYSELNRLFNNTVDIFATVGTGKAGINDPYNQQLLEIIATSDDQVSWDDITRRSASILSRERTGDYLLPGSLPAILHKMMDARQID